MALHAFAVTAPGLEPLAAAELRALGVADASAEPGGVSFVATELLLATTLLQLRTVSRVIVRAAEFRVLTFAQLEKRAKAIPWETWLAPNARVRFRVTCRKSRLYHSDAVAERLAGGVTSRVRGAAIETGAADEDDDVAQLIVVRVADDVCTVSIDAGGALHRRGYRRAVAKAPMRETLAAAMLMGAGWNGSTALCDPMCGSGTLVIEGALIARRMAPGLRRSFAAERWPSATGSVWVAARADAQAMVLPSSPVPLAGSDRDEGAITAACANAARAGVADDTVFTAAPVSVATAPAPRGLLVTNPPYGVRVGESQELRNLYARLGRVAREAFAGWEFAVLSGDRSRGHVLERQLGLSLREVWRSTNGGIPVRLLAS